MSNDFAFAFDRLKKAAAGLPEVEESTWFNTPSLKVRGKSLCRVKDPDTVVVMVALEEKEMLIQAAPDIYFETDHYKGWPAMLVRIRAISDAELAAAQGAEDAGEEGLTSPSVSEHFREHSRRPGSIAHHGRKLAATKQPWTVLAVGTRFHVMKRLAPIVAFLVLAIFAAGTVVHATAATGMALRMAAAVAADAGMDGCEACDETNGAPVACDQTCVQPIAALPACGPVEAAFAPASLRQAAPHGLVGRTGPPERHPPR